MGTALAPTAVQYVTVNEERDERSLDNDPGCETHVILKPSGFMGAERYAGYFMLVTALIIAVPVVLQIRSREADFRHAWAPVLFFIGLAATGCAFAFVHSDKQTSIAVAGVAAMLVSLLFAQAKVSR